MGLIYTGMGPLAIINRDVCPLTLPAASLLVTPFAHSFENDPIQEINTGDEVRMELINGKVSIHVMSRFSEG